MRFYGWLVVGLSINYESLLLVGEHQKLSKILSTFILNPILFFQAACLLIIGAYFSAFAFRGGLVLFSRQNPATHQKKIYGMLYFTTLVGGWIWLLLTLFWGGMITIALTLILIFFWGDEASRQQALCKAYLD